MGNSGETEILDHIPILHVRGTNYEIGLSIGRTFKGMIQELYSTWGYVNNSILPNYNTKKGKEIFQNALGLCENKFPRYVEELRGVADGSGVEFAKIFMAHVDSLAEPITEQDKKIKADSGCSSILCNRDEIILAQNEDGFPENVNKFFILSAEVLDADGNKLEKFSAFTYAGVLSGLAMGYNEHGLVFSINTLVAKDKFENGTPWPFATRAVLGAKNHKEVLQIVADEGTGYSDGFNINICYTNKQNKNKGIEMFTIEVAPPKMGEQNSPGTQKSQVKVYTVPQGESFVHCNRYLHMKVDEVEDYLTSSKHRHAAIAKMSPPSNMQSIKNILSDQSDSEYPVYRRFQKNDKDKSKTIATGIFNIGEKKWFLYVNPPAKCQASAVIHMDL